MYKGDHSRKMNLSEYGFRLPSCLDNRPLKFEEWEKIDSYEKKKAKEPAPRKKILSIKEMLNICKI